MNYPHLFDLSQNTSQKRINSVNKIVILNANRNNTNYKLNDENARIKYDLDTKIYILVNPLFINSKNQNKVRFLNLLTLQSYCLKGCYRRSHQSIQRTKRYIQTSFRRAKRLSRDIKSKIFTKLGDHNVSWRYEMKLDAKGFSAQSAKRRDAIILDFDGDEYESKT